MSAETHAESNKKIACRRVHATHSRAISSITFFPALPFASHVSATYNLFATTAPDGVAKLWDVRTLTPVRTFGAHTNSQHRVGTAMSPCARFFAVGSEDQSVVLYDMQSGGVVDRIREVRRLPSALCFFPCMCPRWYAP